MIVSDANTGDLHLLEGHNIIKVIKLHSAPIKFLKYLTNYHIMISSD